MAWTFKKPSELKPGEIIRSGNGGRWQITEVDMPFVAMRDLSDGSEVRWKVLRDYWKCCVEESV